MTGVRSHVALELKNNAGIPRRSFSEDAFNTNTIANYNQFADTTTTWSIASGKLTAAAGGVQSVLTWFGYVAQDTYVEADVSQARDAGLVVRLSDNNNYYLLTFNDAGGASPNTMTFFKRVAGTFTSLGAYPVVWPAGTTRTVRFQAVGSQLSAFIDGVFVGAVNDTTFISPGSIGMRANGATASTFEHLRWNPSDVTQYDPYWNNVVSLLNFETLPTSNTFIDERDHRLGWTAAGQAQTTFIEKKYGGCSLQVATTNGLIGTYIRASDGGPEWDSGAADFTVEGWAFSDGTAQGILCCQRDPAAPSSADRGISVFCNGDSILRASMGSSNGVGSANVNGLIPAYNAWFHWAYTRQGSTFRLFINGLMVGSVTATPSPANGFGMTLGGDPSGTGTLSWRGYIDSFRYTVGVARYTQTFYVVDQPFAMGNAPWEQKPVPRVVTLHRFNGQNNFSGPYYDDTGKQWVGSGPGQVFFSAGTHRFGQTSLVCQTYANSYIDTLFTSDFAFGTGAWTIESWVQFLTFVPDNRTKWIFDFRETGAATSGLAIGVNGSGFLQVIYNNTIYGATGVNVGTFAWAHLQVCYDGKTLYGYVDGALQWSVVVRIFLPAARLRMGGDTTGLLGFQGNFDETRILANVCNNTAAFVRPESPFVYEAVPYDPYLNSVASLMNFSGANNATLAAEDKGKLLTFNGAAALATNTLPGNSGLAAVRLDGNGGYLTSTNGNSLGSGDFKISLGAFTFECWFKTTDFRTQALMESVIQSGTNSGWYLNITSSGFLNLNIRSSGSGTNVATGTTNVIDGKWHHVAVVRSGTSHVIWLDGEQEKTVTVTAANISSTPGFFAVGAFANTRLPANDFRGFITGVRITNGVARYTKSFTPPRFGHPTLGYDYDHAWQSATMITLGFDSANGIANFWDEASGRTWRNQGGASITSARSRFGGSSMQVTGSQHIYTMHASELNWGGNAFTIEFSMYINSFTPNATIMAKSSTGVGSWGIYFDSTGKQICYSNDQAGNATLVSPVVMAAGQWYDIVLSRDPNTLLTDLRINGQLVMEVYNETVDTSTNTPLRIGGDASNVGMVGYLDEIRITSYATATLGRRYMGSSNVRNRRFPRGELPPDGLYAQTILMLHFDQTINGSAFVDSSIFKQVPSSTTNCAFTLADGKFGPGCMTKSAAAGGMVYANNSSMNIGTNDFTIEMWIYRTSVGSQVTLFDTRPTAGSALGVLGVDGNDAFYWYSTNAFRVQTAAGQSIVNTWQYICVSRYAGATRIFLNGVLMAAAYSDAQSYSGAQFTIGNDVAFSTGFVGKMDEIRVTQGSSGGRYNAAFTLPQARWWLNGYYEDANQKSKVLSLHFDGADTGTVFTDVMGHTATRVGTPTTSQAVIQLGTASGRFTGTDALTFDGSLPEFNLGAQDFTMRFWIRFVNLTGGNMKYIFSKSTIDTYYYSWRYAINENGRFVATFWVEGGTCICALESKTIASINSWFHFQAVRSGDTFLLFINGKVEASYTMPAAAPFKKLFYLGSQKVVVGAQSDAANGVNAYIDELQLYAGVAINTTDFVPYALVTPDV